MQYSENPSVIASRKHIELKLGLTEHKERIAAIGKALSSPVRIDILNLLRSQPLAMQEISKTLGIPLSSTTMHIKSLEAAGLVITENQPGIHGSMRICVCAFGTFLLDAYATPTDADRTIFLDMPIGSYSDFHVEPTCGLAGMTGVIESYDTPMSFYSTRRHEAQLLWFNQGYIEYRFPNKIDFSMALTELDFSLEICSEAPAYCDRWPSDITFYINDHEIGTYTSPGDFGIRRGKLTPEVWPSGLTQFGLLTSVSLRQNGAYINKKPVNESISLENIDFTKDPYISFKIEIKENAENIGGINIFGEKYGDHAQNINLRIVQQNKVKKEEV